MRMEEESLFIDLLFGWMINLYIYFFSKWLLSMYIWKFVSIFFFIFVFYYWYLCVLCFNYIELIIVFRNYCVLVMFLNS